MTSDNRAAGPAAEQLPVPKFGRWWVVASTVAAMAVSAPAVTQFGISISLAYVVRDLGWTRGGASSAISLFLLGLSVSVPLFGALVDRFGARLPAVSSVLLFAAALALTSLAPTKTAFLLLLPIAGLVGGGTTVIPYVVTIATRFDRNRGLALGIGAAGVGLGGVILPRLIEWIEAAHGWRVGFLCLAAIVPLVALPGAWLTLNQGPAHSPVAARGEPARVQPWRIRAFWIIAISVLLVTVGVGGVIIHAVSLLTDSGLARPLAAGVISFVGLAAVVARITGGLLMDRFHAPLISAGFFVLAGLALLLLLVGTPAATVVGLLALGLASGAESDVIAFLSARYLRLPGLGGANGLLMLVFTIANAIGVASLGRLFDLTGSYRVGLAIGAVLALLAAALITRLGPYPGSGPKPSPFDR